MIAAVGSLMADVEDELSAYYGFPLLASAAEHVITRAELVEALGAQAQAQPEWQSRAGVWLVPDRTEGTESVYIGISLDAALTRVLSAADPRLTLDNGNLDAFCILIEELSHFHLLLNRVSAGRPVTRSELEMQGELDKLLICARTLKRQSGDYHVIALARTLYDRAQIVAHDPEPYVQATRFAARFWFGHSEDGPDGVREELRAFYDADWTEKRRSA